MEDYKEMLFSGYSREAAQMNSQQLQQHAQNHKSKPG